MFVFICVLGMMALIYFGFIVFFFTGLLKVKPKETFSEELPQLAVVVAARNEEDYIRATVESLAAQNYPNDKYEIIVVNDRSEDGTGEILKQLQKSVDNLKIITISECPPSISPKKNALIQAVKTIHCQFVLTTDADCIHHPDWLRSYTGLIEDRLGVTTGVTIFYQEEYRNKFEQFWQGMQSIEYMSHQIVMAGAIGHNFGFTANGNNMMFNRQLYIDFEKDALQKNIISGDDFFIIQTAEKEHFRLKFNLSPAAIVKTPPQRSIRAMLNQRARWSSKIGKANSAVLFFSLNTFFFYLGLTVFPVLLLFFPAYWPFFLIFFGIKMCCDSFYMVCGYKKFGQKLKLIHYILMEIVHAPFIVLVAVIGTLFGFTWKGRRFKIYAEK